MRNYAIATDTDLDIRSFPLQLPLHALYASRSIYANYPPFQREEVWPDRYKYELIDSLVSGAYIPDILITSAPDKMSKWVLDGQQRLATMLQFMEALECDINHKPIPRDRQGHEYFYFRLTERQQQKLKQRIIKFTELVDVSEDMLAMTFLRLQNQISLTTAEKLWASPSAVRNVASQVYEHSYYDTIYEGKTTRRQTFQMSVYPVSIEMFKPFGDMTSTRLQALAKGKRDELVYAGMADAINRRMSYIEKLYSGVKSGAMTELIIQYQSIWLLDFIGCDFDSTPTGALVPWYRNVERLNSDYRQRGFMNLFAQFTNNKTQRMLWQEWLEEIVYGGFVRFTNQLQADAQLQRVTGWLRNSGICPECNNQHVRLVDVGAHIFRPADAHLSNRQTCKSGAKQIHAVAV